MLQTVKQFMTVIKKSAMHYDIVDDSWKEYNGSYNIQEAKLNLINCMRDFLADGYLDKKFNNSAESYYFQVKNVFKRWIGLETRTQFRHLLVLPPTLY